MVELLCYFRFSHPQLRETDLCAAAEALNISIAIQYEWKNTLSLPVRIETNFLLIESIVHYLFYSVSFWLFVVRAKVTL
jgi:hypothetical protein